MITLIWPSFDNKVEIKDVSNKESPTYNISYSNGYYILIEIDNDYCVLDEHRLNFKLFIDNDKERTFMKLLNEQKLKVEYWKLKCQNCSRMFYEFGGLDLCPHCSSMVRSDDPGETRVYLLELNPKTGDVIVFPNGYEEQLKRHLERLENDIELIKVDIIKGAASAALLESQLALTRGAATGLRQAINIVMFGDAYTTQGDV
jgi:hypothetical protein